MRRDGCDHIVDMVMDTGEIDFRLHKIHAHVGIAAVKRAQPLLQDAVALIVGNDEEGIKKNIYNNSIYKEKIHFVNFTDKPEQYMAAADLFCLPSYREGFGMAAVEAGSCGLPVITSRIYGLTDAVEEGVTGLMHSPGDVEELKKLIEYLIKNKNIMKILGSKSIKRNNFKFSNHLVEKNFVNYLQETVK